MLPRYLLCGLAAVALHAQAAEPASSAQPVPQRAVATKNSVRANATAPNSAVATRLAAPRISQTTAVRGPDGRLTIDCTEQTNPKARAINAKLPTGPNAKVPQQ